MIAAVPTYFLIRLDRNLVLRRTRFDAAVHLAPPLPFIVLEQATYLCTSSERITR